MDTIFMNSENNETPKPHVYYEICLLSNIIIYYSWKNIKSSYNNNEFKTSAQAQNDNFELPDGLYSVSDIQDYFEHILKKRGEDIDKPSVQIYVNKIKYK